GDFRAGLEAALGAVDYEARRREQAELRGRGVYRGIGLSGYVEGTAIGPYEGATGRMDAPGRAVVGTGGAGPGPGGGTVVGRGARGVWGMRGDGVGVGGGAPGAIRLGTGRSGGGRGVTGGSWTQVGGGRVRDKLVAGAAALVEGAPADIEIADGAASVRGTPA